MKYFFVLLFFLSQCEFFSQSVNYPKTDKHKLNKIYFVNSQTGWIIGEYGSLLKTTNAGANWVDLSYDTSLLLKVEYYDIFFIDSLNGWLSGFKYSDISINNGKRNSKFGFNKGFILKTTNGGAEWSEENLITDEGLKFLHFDDNETGVVIGWHGTVYKTTDRGESWSIISNEVKTLLRGEVETESIETVNFKNNKIYMGGYYGSLLVSTDQGYTWEKTNPLNNNGIYSVNFINENTGWITADFEDDARTYGKILKTTDGGLNWIVKFNSSVTSSGLQDISFAGSKFGYSFSELVLVKTNNGGENWEKNLLRFYPKSLYFIDSSAGFLAGTDGLIYKTTDSGQQWFTSDGKSLIDTMHRASCLFKINYASKKYDVDIAFNNCTDSICECLNGDAKIKLYRKGEDSPFQVLESEECYPGPADNKTGKLLVNYNELYGEESVLYFGDFNFDKEEDLAVSNGHYSCYGGPSYDIYLYSKSENKFVKNDTLTSLAEGPYCGLFFIDTVKKVLKTFSKSGCCWHQNSEFKYINGVLTEVFTETDEITADGREMITTEKLINDEWRKTVRYVKNNENDK